MPKESPDSKNTEQEDAAARLEKLRAKLDAPDGLRKRTEKRVETRQERHNRAGVAQAFRLSSEFIAGVVAGAGIGYLIDTFFGTSPWGLIIFLMLGFAAAVLNVMRAAGMVAESSMRLKPAHDLQNSRDDEETGRDTQNKV